MAEVKVSLIIPVYNSHEIVRRQLIWLKNMALPFEILIVDDCSYPPIDGAACRTDNRLAWTQGLARNLGATKAQGEYLFMTDIDHIISKEAMEDALNFTGNKMIFRRRLGMLTNFGHLRTDRKALDEWGARPGSLDASVHGNTFVMKKSVFMDLGGYDRETCVKGFHPKSRSGDDCYFNAKWNRRFAGEQPVMGRGIFLFPTGRFHSMGDLNPHGFFHDLTHEQKVTYKNA